MAPRFPVFRKPVLTNFALPALLYATFQSLSLNNFSYFNSYTLALREARTPTRQGLREQSAIAGFTRVRKTCQTDIHTYHGKTDCSQHHYKIGVFLLYVM
jgi:hypothetical protein